MGREAARKEGQEKERHREQREARTKSLFTLIDGCRELHLPGAPDLQWEQVSVPLSVVVRHPTTVKRYPWGATAWLGQAGLLHGGGGWG